MRSFFISAKLFCLCALLTGVFGVRPGSAQTITGTVTNKTTNKAAAGDDVVLIRLAQGMQEAARTKTDSRGHYSIALPDPGLHLVRVTHDKANYFQPAPPGTTTVNLDVYNAAAKVEGVVGEAEVMRLQTDETGKTLRVVENFFVRNDSSPPMTQFSDRPFEFFLPPGAVVEGSAALAPAGMAVQASPVPLGDPDHYAFIFPIRPGETRFQVSYHLPYSGSLQLTPKPVTTVDTIAVILPKSMTFKGGNATPYSSVQDEVSGQTYVARNVSPSQPLSFTVSGTGQMPRDSQAPAAGEGAGQAGADAQGTAASDTRPGGGLGNPVDPGASNDPWAKYRWWIIGGLGLALAAGAGVMLKRPTGEPAGAAREVLPEGTGIATHAAGAPGTILSALKEELFTLETERLQGTVTEAEYSEHKTALEQVLRRALQRSAGTTTMGKDGVAADLAARSGMSS